jgi:hypothetical protein
MPGAEDKSCFLRPNVTRQEKQNPRMESRGMDAFFFSFARAWIFIRAAAMEPCV